MKSINQVKTGILSYIDKELMPHISGWKQVAASAYVTLAAENLANEILLYKKHPAISLLNIFDDKNNIDIDKLYKAITSGMKQNNKFDIDIPFIGKFTFDITDIDKLYEYIKEA